MRRIASCTTRVVADVILLIAVLLGPGLFYEIGRPARRGFYCDDETIKYPYRDDTVTMAMLIGITVALPFFLIALSEFTLFKCVRGYRREVSSSTELYVVVHRACVAFLFGAAACQLVVDIAKYTVGRLRPHFIAVCQPDYSIFNCSLGYITAEVCTGTDDVKMKAARQSFPSGHASMSFYGMVYFMMYIQSRVTWRSVFLLKPFLLSGCLCVSVFISVSRIHDNKHHPLDVGVGAFVGVVSALVFSVFVGNLYPARMWQPDPEYPTPVLKSKLTVNSGSRDTDISAIS